MSAGIYCPPEWSTRLRGEYAQIINEVLNEVVPSSGLQVGRYFHQVILTILQQYEFFVAPASVSAPAPTYEPKAVSTHEPAPVSDSVSNPAPKTGSAPSSTVRPLPAQTPVAVSVPMSVSFSESTCTPMTGSKTLSMLESVPVPKFATIPPKFAYVSKPTPNPGQTFAPTSFSVPASALATTNKTTTNPLRVFAPTSFPAPTPAVTHAPVLVSKPSIAPTPVPTPAQASVSKSALKPDLAPVPAVTTLHATVPAAPAPVTVSVSAPVFAPTSFPAPAPAVVHASSLVSKPSPAPAPLPTPAPAHASKPAPKPDLAPVPVVTTLHVSVPETALVPETASVSAPVLTTGCTPANTTGPKTAPKFASKSTPKLTTVPVSLPKPVSKSSCMPVPALALSSVFVQNPESVPTFTPGTVPPPLTSPVIVSGNITESTVETVIEIKVKIESGTEKKCGSESQVKVKIEPGTESVIITLEDVVTYLESDIFPCGKDLKDFHRNLGNVKKKLTDLKFNGNEFCRLARGSLTPEDLLSKFSMRTITKLYKRLPKPEISVLDTESSEIKVQKGKDEEDLQTIKQISFTIGEIICYCETSSYPSSRGVMDHFMVDKFKRKVVDFRSRLKDFGINCQVFIILTRTMPTEFLSLTYSKSVMKGLNPLVTRALDYETHVKSLQNDEEKVLAIKTFKRDMEELARKVFTDLTLDPKEKARLNIQKRREDKQYAADERVFITLPFTIIIRD